MNCVTLDDVKQKLYYVQKKLKETIIERDNYHNQILKSCINKN